MNQSQREALIDLLVFSIFADAHISLQEDAALEAILAEIGWDSPRPREIHFCNSMSRARKAAESTEATAEYIASRTAIFDDSDSKFTLIDYLERVLSSDATVEAESAFLRQVRAS